MKNLLKDFAIFAFLALAIGPCACEATEALQTVFNGTKIQEGDVWEITTGAVGVFVEQIALHMESNTINIQVWSRPGIADPYYADSYVQAFTGTVTGQGQGVPTVLPPFATSVEIPPYSSHTFYTTGTTDPLSIFYTDGSALQSTFASDSYIDIKEGWSMRFPFNNSPQFPTQWNGIVYYSVAAQPPSPPPTLSPTTATPTSGPTPKPTTAEPSASPTVEATLSPSVSLDSSTPSLSPSKSGEPSSQPSMNPTSSEPSVSPTKSVKPSTEPTLSPTLSFAPTGIPSASLSSNPSYHPTIESMKPSIHPSPDQSALPSSLPTKLLTSTPTSQPTLLPTSSLFQSPSHGPSSPPSTSQPSADTHEPTTYSPSASSSSPTTIATPTSFPHPTSTPSSTYPPVSQHYETSSPTYYPTYHPNYSDKKDVFETVQSVVDRIRRNAWVRLFGSEKNDK